VCYVKGKLSESLYYLTYSNLLLVNSIIYLNDRSQKI